MDRPEKMSKLENINHVYASVYEGGCQGMCVGVQIWHIPSTIKFPGKASSGTTGYEVRVRMTEQSKSIWRYDYLEWFWSIPGFN